MDDLQKAYRKATRNWFNDGINEMLLGGILLLLGIYFGLIVIFPQGSMIKTAIEASFVLFVIAGAFGLNKLAAVLKERITYPRSGYVIFKTDRRLPRWISAILLMFISSLSAGIVTALLANMEDYLRWLPALSGVLISIALLVIAVRVRIFRILIEAVIALVLGAALSWLRIGDYLGLSLYYLVLGMIILFIAGYILWQFMRQNPLSAEEPYEQ